MTVAEAKGEYFGCLIYQFGGVSSLLFGCESISK
jgi:hypothetical protein